MNQRQILVLEDDAELRETLEAGRRRAGLTVRRTEWLSRVHQAAAQRRARLREPGSRCYRDDYVGLGGLAALIR